MSVDPGSDIPATTLLDPATVEDPYGFYARLRAEAPVWRVPGTNVFAVASFAAVAETVARTDDFSSVVRSLLYRSDDGLPAQMPLGDHTTEALASSDPPVHTVHRKTVFPELVARRMAELEGDIHSLSEDLTGRFVAAGGGDYMNGVANQVPITMIGRLIGFRDADHDELLRAAFASTELVGGTRSLEDLAALMEDTLTVAAWIQEQVSAGDPGDGTLLATVGRGIESGDLSLEEGTIVLHTLLSAGGESTTSLIGNAVRILAERQDVQARLRDEPELLPNFVEEVLRFESPFRQQMRSAAVDTELMGVDVPAGSTMLVLFSSANRDENEFDRSEDFVVDRDNARHHVAFGRGIHFCVGAPLARLEANVVLRSLLDATSTVALDPSAGPTRVYSLLARRHSSLPLVVA